MFTGAVVAVVEEPVVEAVNVEACEDVVVVVVTHDDDTCTVALDSSIFCTFNVKL